MKTYYDDMERYHRQIIMPEIGKKGQLKLKSAKVFLLGLGGLGSISALYLAASGVGHLRIVDTDVVEITNLNRQLLHWTEDVGREKTASAKEKLQRLNPECKIEGFRVEVNDKNVKELTEGFSVLLDGTDNLETRYILNGLSIARRVPFIFGGVDGFNGMATTFIPGETPCLECLFPRKTTEKKTPGILGAVAGLVACIQTIETIKVILGMKDQLKGRLLYMRTSDMSFKKIKIDKNPYCKACSQQRGIYDHED